MERTIVAFRPDALGEWIAELDCGHCQHVRHRPPFQLRPWVLEAQGRARHVGTACACPLCDEDERNDERNQPLGTPPLEQGGDPACWAGVLCPACGAVPDRGAHDCRRDASS